MRKKQQTYRKKISAGEQCRIRPLSLLSEEEYYSEVRPPVLPVTVLDAREVERFARVQRKHLIDFKNSLAELQLL